MIGRKSIENYLLSNHKDLDGVVKYRIKLFNVLLTAIMILSGGMALARFMEPNSLILFFMDFGLATLSAGAIYALRKDIDNLQKVSIGFLSIVFVLLSMVILLVGIADVTFWWSGMWFSTLIVGAFVLSGEKVGQVAFIASSLLYIVLFSLHYDLLMMSVRDLSTILLAFFVITLVLTLSEKRHADTTALMKKKNNLLSHQLSHDAHTELPNQRSLYLQIAKEENLSLLYLDIDNFDTLNSTLGRKNVDAIMISVAMTLTSFESKNISLFHLGTDEFVFTIINPKENEDLLLAKEIKLLFNRRLHEKDVNISCTLSIGIARGEKENIILNAQSAMQAVKKEGKDGHKLFVYDKDKEEKHKNFIYWLGRIKEIILEDKLMVYYQPIVNNKTQKVEKYECLIRAIDGEKVLTPYVFLDAVKSIGMLPDITKKVIDSSFKTFEHTEYEFSINITQEDLIQNYLPDLLEKKLKEFSIKPEQVILEVLENITIESRSKQFEAFSKMGIRVAIDDFGAQESNFSRLMDVDVDIIKIDALFIRNIDKDENSKKIVETIVFLAAGMGAKTVAEFVHSEAVYEVVNSLGVDYSQGYYFSPPLPQIVETHLAQTPKPSALASS